MSDAIDWHTEGRRQPTLIGKDASGRRIPGGPYVVWQFAALPVGGVLWATRSMWAGETHPIAQVLAVLVGTAAVGWLIGRIDFAGLNPAHVIGAACGAWWRAIAAPHGVLGSQPVETAKAPKPPKLSMRPITSSMLAAVREPPIASEDLVSVEDLLTSQSQSDTRAPATAEGKPGPAAVARRTPAPSSPMSANPMSADPVAPGSLKPAAPIARTAGPASALQQFLAAAPQQ